MKSGVTMVELTVEPLSDPWVVIPDTAIGAPLVMDTLLPMPSLTTMFDGFSAEASEFRQFVVEDVADRHVR